VLQPKGILVALWYWLPPLLMMAFIYSLSAQPVLPQAPGELLDAVLKKLSHVMVYAVLFLLLWRAWRYSRPRLPARHPALLMTALYAVSDEVHQSFVPGRHSNWYDVLFDVSVPFLLWWIGHRRGRRGILGGKDEDLGK